MVGRREKKGGRAMRYQVRPDLFPADLMCADCGEVLRDLYVEIFERPFCVMCGAIRELDNPSLRAMGGPLVLLKSEPSWMHPPRADE